jgi:hypothetical protein
VQPHDTNHFFLDSDERHRSPIIDVNQSVEIAVGAVMGRPESSVTTEHINLIDKDARSDYCYLARLSIAPLSAVQKVGEAAIEIMGLFGVGRFPRRLGFRGQLPVRCPSGYSGPGSITPAPSSAACSSSDLMASASAPNAAKC